MSIRFEDQPSDRQVMTFKTYREFAGKNLEKLSLPDGAYSRSKVYSNFALFFSDQCPWHIVLRYKNNEKNYIGPLFIQLNECLLDLKESTPFVKLFNRVARYKRYPGVAVQEALENALFHFDASRGFEIMVDVTEDMMTITSPGSTDCTDDSIVNCGPRNPKLAQFIRMYGEERLSHKGMTLIKGCYSSTGLMPIIISDTDCFKIVLPSLDNRAHTVTQGHDMVLEYLKQNNRGSVPVMCKTMAFTMHRMALILDHLEDEGRIFTTGLGAKRVAYYIKDLASSGTEISNLESGSAFLTYGG